MAKNQADAGKNAHAVVRNGIPMFVKVGIAVLVILTLAVAGIFAYRFYTLQQQTGNKANLSSEPAELVEQVGKLIELPINEQPTIATVSDVEKLKGQEFFVKAQNGDKVLIYQNAKKAILYRPATGKIVDVGPVNIDQTATASESAVAGAETESETKEKTTPTPTEGQKITVAIYNGTQRSGLTRSAETQLDDEYPSANVTQRTNAKLDYKETLVIDTTGKNKTQAAAIAKVVGGKVGNMQRGESSPSAAILIILGDNYKTE